MKPEPLKRKFNCNNTLCRRNQGVKCTHYFYEKDIKSAVEWFKHKVEVNLEGTTAECIIYKIEEWVDIAFEDVIKIDD